MSSVKTQNDRPWLRNIGREGGFVFKAITLFQNCSFSCESCCDIDRKVSAFRHFASVRKKLVHVVTSSNLCTRIEAKVSWSSKVFCFLFTFPPTNICLDTPINPAFICGKMDVKMEGIRKFHLVRSGCFGEMAKRYILLLPSFWRHHTCSHENIRLGIIRHVGHACKT